MDSPRNAPPGLGPAPVATPLPPSLPLALRRGLGGLLLGGTMWLAGLLALWRAVAVSLR